MCFTYRKKGCNSRCFLCLRYLCLVEASFIITYLEKAILFDISLCGLTTCIVPSHYYFFHFAVVIPMEFDDLGFYTSSLIICTDTWGQLVLLTTILNHKTCINTSRQVLEKTLFAINASKREH